MNQGRGLQGLPRFFLRQPSAGQFPQFLVHERQQLLGGVRVTLLDGRQDAGDFAQRCSGAWDDVLFP